MSILTGANIAGLTADKDWPEDVRLYQPFEVEQILMDEFAACLSVKTLLNMLQLPFQIELKINAHNMSPSGEVPFLKVDEIIVSEFEPIVEFLAAKGYSLSSTLTSSENADMRACLVYVIKCFKNTLLYVTWKEEETYQKVTKGRYGSAFSWPLSSLLPWLKRQETLRHLTSQQLTHKSLEQMYDDFDECCAVLVAKLGDKDFFFGDKPTELDALVFGFLYCIITTSLPSQQLADLIHKHQALKQLVNRIHQQFFTHEMQ